MLENNTIIYTPPEITILLQPEEKTFTIKNPKTVKQLLVKLNLREETALVIRNNQLLTPDVRLYANDELLVRKVTSLG